MSKITKQPELHPTLVPLEGQFDDAGRCVDGVCAIPEPAPTEPEHKTTLGSPKLRRSKPPEKARI